MLPRYKAIDNETGVMLRVLSIDLEFDYIIGLPFEEEARDTFGELIIEKRYYFEDMELLQSTGLFDKNGKEIYEGDILKVFVLGDEGAIAKVIFKNGMFGIEDDMHGYGYDKGIYSLHQILSLRDAEILGNIYQDEHLLGEE